MTSAHFTIASSVNAAAMAAYTWAWDSFPLVFLRHDQLVMHMHKLSERQGHQEAEQEGELPFPGVQVCAQPKVGDAVQISGLGAGDGECQGSERGWLGLDRTLTRDTCEY